MNKPFHLVLLSSFFFLTGCSTLGVIQDLMPTKPVEVNTVALPAPMYHPPLPMERDRKWPLCRGFAQKVRMWLFPCFYNRICI